MPVTCQRKFSGKFTPLFKRFDSERLAHVAEFGDSVISVMQAIMSNIKFSVSGAY
jgi:hypothetical protein